jgi:hypothetical protein
MLRLAIPALVVLAALAGCGRQTGTLSVSARAATAAAPGAAPASPLLADARVELQRVRMVIRDIKLEQEGAGEEVEATNGPFLLDLAGSELGGGIKQVFSISVPTGTYDDLRFVVHKLEDGERIGDEVIDASRASIVLDLVVEGEQVRFTSDVDERQRIAGTFVVGEGGSADNITVQIDPKGWFTAGDGSFLDPRVAANRQAIEENLQASIDAFDDDDRDGHDDGGNDDGPGHS